MKSNLKESEINIFPNPAHKFINISCLSGIEIKIHNSLGEELLKLKTQTKNTQINCSDWPSGMYFIEAKKIRYKIIINH